MTKQNKNQIKEFERVYKNKSGVVVMIKDYTRKMLAVCSDEKISCNMQLIADNLFAYSCYNSERILPRNGTHNEGIIITALYSYLTALCRGNIFLRACVSYYALLAINLNARR